MGVEGRGRLPSSSSSSAHVILPFPASRSRSCHRQDLGEAFFFLFPPPNMSVTCSPEILNFCLFVRLRERFSAWIFYKLYLFRPRRRVLVIWAVVLEVVTSTGKGESQIILAVISHSSPTTFDREVPNPFSAQVSAKVVNWFPRGRPQQTFGK